MTANELLESLLARAAEQLPGAEARWGWSAKGESRRTGGPSITGQVLKEAFAGEGWEARLGLNLYLPKAQGPEEAERLALALAQAARGLEPAPDSVERGALSVDKQTGALLISVTVVFKQGTGASSQGGACTVLLEGRAYAASGWKVSVGEAGGGLTAIGEGVPFAYKSRRSYTVELQGLPQEALDVPDGFSLRLGGRTEVYEDCRWKTRTAAGAGVLVSETRKKGE